MKVEKSKRIILGLILIIIGFLSFFLSSCTNNDVHYYNGRYYPSGYAHRSYYDDYNNKSSQTYYNAHHYNNAGVATGIAGRYALANKGNKTTIVNKTVINKTVINKTVINKIQPKKSNVMQSTYLSKRNYKSSTYSPANYSTYKSNSNAVKANSGGWSSSSSSKTGFRSSSSRRK